jgi:hypothetical protein
MLFQGFLLLFFQYGLTINGLHFASLTGIKARGAIPIFPLMSAKLKIFPGKFQFSVADKNSSQFFAFITFSIAPISLLIIFPVHLYVRKLLFLFAIFSDDTKNLSDKIGQPSIELL